MTLGLPNYLWVEDHEPAGDQRIEIEFCNELGIIALKNRMVVYYQRYD
jgi:hypothetical protein